MIIVFCNSQIGFAAAKVQISGNNTKQKSVFFVFIVERKYFRAKLNGRNKWEQYKTKKVFLFLLSK